MNERETRKLKTPLGKEVVIKTYLTARERKQVRDVFLSAMKASAGTEGDLKISELPGDVIGKAEEKLIEAVVVSYDGKTENILDRLLDSQTREYDFVLAEANKLQSDFPPAK